MKPNFRTVRLRAEALERRDLMSAAAAVVPNDAGYSLQWGLQNIGAPAAWAITTGTGSTTVAVIDTGIDSGDADLAGNLLPSRGYNFVSNNTNPEDNNDHGTAVASVIGADGNNGLGIAGIDWHAKIIALKAMDASGAGTTAEAVAALNAAVADGARIVNMSFAGGGYDPTFYNALVNARNHGVIVVVAAGNESSDDDSTPSYPTDYGLDNIISVAAINSSNQLASFSNYGATTVDLAAPGVGITTEIKGGSLANYSGTSLAAPFVSGAAELIWDLHPTWTYKQVIADIENNVDPIASLKGKTVTGGKLDLAKAIEAGITVAVPAPAATAARPAATVAASVATNFSNSSSKSLNGVNSVSTSITIAQNIAISRIAIGLNITDSADGNLTITLKGPNGQSIVLVDQRGGTGQSFTNTVLDDYGSTYIGRVAAPFSGTYKPDTALAAFKGMNAKGTWTLTVTSNRASNLGTLLNWSITVNPGSTATIKSVEEEEIIAPLAVPAPSPKRAVITLAPTPMTPLPFTPDVARLPAPAIAAGVPVVGSSAANPIDETAVFPDIYSWLAS